MTTLTKYLVDGITKELKYIIFGNQKEYEEYKDYLDVLIVLTLGYGSAFLN
ncbi:MAG: hypothetical protein ACTSR3_22490 [Candidatus Helarchaeota archaeon]